MPGLTLVRPGCMVLRMTRQALQSKFDYHSDLANEAEEHGNINDMIIEDARAELAFIYLTRARQ